MHQSRPPVVAVVEVVAEVVVDVETLPVAAEADTGAAVVDIASARGLIIVFCLVLSVEYFLTIVKLN